jgi:hypothetical protein
MPFKYVKVEETLLPNGEYNHEAQMRNNAVLSDGVKGIECIGSRYPTQGERMDYAQFIPWGCHLSTVETYENGAKNFYVHEGHNDKNVGYLIYRPMGA